MLKRNLFATKTLSVESFMYLKVPESRNDVYDMTVFPVVNFRYVPQKGEYTQDMKMLTFKMTPRNHWKVLKFLNTLLKWMDEKDDLFMHDDQNDLIFNYDYKDLIEMIKSNFTDAQIMKAAPAVLSYNETKVPGVCLYINKTNQMCQLTSDEVAQLFSVIRDFKFQEEVVVLTQLYELYTSGKIQKDFKGSSNSGNSPWGV